MESSFLAVQRMLPFRWFILWLIWWNFNEINKLKEIWIVGYWTLHYKQTNQTNNWKISTASSSLCLSWHKIDSSAYFLVIFSEKIIFSASAAICLFFYIKFANWETINWDLLMLSNFILAKVIIIRRRNCQYLPVKCYIMVCFNLFVLSNNVFHFRLISFPYDLYNKYWLFYCHWPSAGHV